MTPDDQQLSNFKHLLRINLELNSYTNLDVLLDQIVKEAVNVTGAEAASLWLVNDNNSLEITPKCILSPISVDRSQLKVRIGEGIVGRVILSGQPEFISDVRKDRGWAERVDQKTGFTTKSILCIPLKTDRVFGALQLLNKQNGELFTENDAELATAFANLASVAYEKNRLYYRQQQWLTNTLDVLVNMIELRNPSSSGHSTRVAAYAEALGRALGLPEEELTLLKWGSYLHDIGKLTMDENDSNAYRSHPEVGARIISKIDPDNELEQLFFIVACHHQYLDGSGFPEEDSDTCFVPLVAQIVGMANLFDNLTVKQQLDSKTAVETVVSGHKYDVSLVEALKRFVAEREAETYTTLKNRLNNFL